MIGYFDHDYNCAYRIGFRHTPIVACACDCGYVVAEPKPPVDYRPPAVLGRTVYYRSNGTVWAAIITRVEHDNRATLLVFDPDFGDRIKKQVPYEPDDRLGWYYPKDDR